MALFSIAPGDGEFSLTVITEVEGLLASTMESTMRGTWSASGIPCPLFLRESGTFLLNAGTACPRMAGREPLAGQETPR